MEAATELVTDAVQHWGRRFRKGAGQGRRSTRNSGVEDGREGGFQCGRKPSPAVRIILKHDQETAEPKRHGVSLDRVTGTDGARNHIGLPYEKGLCRLIPPLAGQDIDAARPNEPTILGSEFENMVAHPILLSAANYARTKAEHHQNGKH